MTTFTPDPPGDGSNGTSTAPGPDLTAEPKGRLQRNHGPYAGTMLEEIVDAAVAIAGSDFGNIQLQDPQTRELRIEASRNFPQSWLAWWNAAARGRERLGVAATHAQLVSLMDLVESLLDIESAVGNGTTLHVLLPRATSPGVGALEPLADVDTPMGNGERILVVEDNDDVRQVTIARLESLNYVVVEANGGPRAIEALTSGQHIDLVFSDVVMPGGMSGYDVGRWVRTNRPALNVLLTSGNEEPARGTADDKEKFRLLPKPYTRSQLARAVRRALTG